MQGPQYDVALSRCVGPSETKIDSQSVGPSLVSVWGPQKPRCSVNFWALIRMWGPRWPGWTKDLWDTRSPSAGPSIRCDSQSVCGALGGLDGHSIYGALIRVWVLNLAAGSSIWLSRYFSPCPSMAWMMGGHWTIYLWDEGPQTERVLELIRALRSLKDPSQLCWGPLQA